MGLLNERIKLMRQKRNMTLAYVAECLGIKEATMQRYESGEIKNIKHETITKLADIFNCSPAFLMGCDEKISNNSFFISDLEKKIVIKYREADSIDKEIIHRTLHIEKNITSSHQESNVKISGK